MNKLIQLAVAVLTATALFSVVGHAEEKGGFKKRHPRRAEVNERERHQQKRIAEGIKNGKISPDEAKKLEGEEAALKKEERTDVKANGGYLTKDQQKQLNKEENGISKEIKQDKTN